MALPLTGCPGPGNPPGPLPPARGHTLFSPGPTPPGDLPSLTGQRLWIPSPKDRETPRASAQAQADLKSLKFSKRNSSCRRGRQLTAQVAFFVLGREVITMGFGFQFCSALLWQ